MNGILNLTLKILGIIGLATWIETRRHAFHIVTILSPLWHFLAFVLWILIVYALTVPGFALHLFVHHFALPLGIACGVISILTFPSCLRRQRKSARSGA